MMRKFTWVGGVLSSVLVAACGGAGTGPEPSAVTSSRSTIAAATVAVTGARTASAAESPTAVQPADSAERASIYEGTIRGVISDSMCGEDHSAMGEIGKDAALCTKKCVAGGATYVLVDEQGVVYELSDQKRPEAFAGMPVVIEGHIDPKRKHIHVHSLAAP